MGCTHSTPSGRVNCHKSTAPPSETTPSLLTTTTAPATVDYSSHRHPPNSAFLLPQPNIIAADNNDQTIPNESMLATSASQQQHQDRSDMKANRLRKKMQRIQNKVLQMNALYHNSAGCEDVLSVADDGGAVSRPQSPNRANRNDSSPRRGGAHDDVPFPHPLIISNPLMNNGGNNENDASNASLSSVSTSLTSLSFSSPAAAAPPYQQQQNITQWPCAEVDSMNNLGMTALFLAAWEGGGGGKPTTTTTRRSTATTATAAESAATATSHPPPPCHQHQHSDLFDVLFRYGASINHCDYIQHRRRLIIVGGEEGGGENNAIASSTSVSMRGGGGGPSSPFSFASSSAASTGPAFPDGGASGGDEPVANTSLTSIHGHGGAVVEVPPFLIANTINNNGDPQPHGGSGGNSTSALSAPPGNSATAPQENSITPNATAEGVGAVAPPPQSFSPTTANKKKKKPLLLGATPLHGAAVAKYDSSDDEDEDEDDEGGGRQQRIGGGRNGDGVLRAHHPQHHQQQEEGAESNFSPPLHPSARAIHSLCDMGSDVNAQDFNGFTALHWLVQFKPSNVEAAKALLMEGCDPHLRSFDVVDVGVMTQKINPPNNQKQTDDDGENKRQTNQHHHHHQNTANSCGGGGLSAVELLRLWDSIVPLNDSTAAEKKAYTALTELFDSWDALPTAAAIQRRHGADTIGSGGVKLAIPAPAMPHRPYNV